MPNYLESLRSMDLAELERRVNQAVQEAIREAHAAGLCTVGALPDGTLVVTDPSGHKTRFEPQSKKEPTPPASSSASV